MSEPRLLRLLTLLQTRPSLSAAELVAHLEVTGRTLRRDVDRLRGLGYPVTGMPGRGGGYRLGRGGRLPPLVLDDEEAVAVAVGLATAAGETVHGVREASLRALVKLDQALPQRLREQVGALRAATTPLPRAAAAVDPTVLVVIARGCEQRLVLRFGYTDAHDRRSQRRVEPFRLVPTGRRWYLVARDTDRDDWRTFRVDRMAETVLGTTTFRREDPPDAAELVSLAIGSRPYRHQARVRVHARAEVVRERVPPTVGTVTEDGPARSVLVTGSDSLDAIAVHLAMLGEPVEVLDPPELDDALRRLAARITPPG